MAEPKIGIRAIFEDGEFRKGVIRYTESLKGMEGATVTTTKTITNKTQEAATSWDQLGKTMGTILSVYMAKRIGEAIWSLGELGATAMRQRAAFEELAKQAGGSADAILAALKRATDGTVADTDIILAANKGIMLGLGAQADQWEKLAEVARFRARAMGLSVTQALNDIATGIGRQSRIILDNLGIILDTEQVYADYAQSIGKAADALSDAEKKQAFLTSVIEDGQAQIEAAGGITGDYADEIERMNAELKNTKTILAEAVAPATAEAAGAIADATPKVTDAANELVTLFEAGLAWVGAALTGKDATEAFTTAITGLSEEGAVLGPTMINWGDAAAEAGDKAREALDAATTAANAYAVALNSISKETKAWAAERTEIDISGMDPYETIEGQEAATQAIIDNQEEIAEAAEKAEEDRVRAQEQALRTMEQNEQDYTNALEQLYDQIVSTTEAANEARIQENRDYAAESLRLEEELAREKVEIEQDLARELDDARRKEQQKEVDAARDLARDLEDLTADLAAENEATWADYYATIESLTQQHGERMNALLARQAAERAAVEAKYGPDPDETVDERREALQAELKALQEAREREHGIASQRELQVIADLEALKAEELAALEAAQEEERQAEEAAYEQEKAQAEQRREEQLAANQAGYEAEAAQRQTAYERQLEDLRISLQREQDERRRSAQQALDDLQARGEQERAELEAQHQARLAEIERDLQAETQAFRDAYTNQLGDLQTYLSQREQQWRDHQAAIESLLEIGSPSGWMEKLGKSMRQGLDIGFSSPSLATDLESAIASFGRGMNNLSLPMSAGGGGGSASNTTHNHNLSVTANYSKPQSERSLRDDLRLNQSMMRMRTGSW